MQAHYQTRSLALRPRRGTIDAVIVRIEDDGAVVRDAEDWGRLRLETDLDAAALRVALAATGTGALEDADTAWLDLAVLRSCAQLAATSPDWAQRWAAMVEHVTRAGLLSADGRSVRVPVER
jgi:hypothetical protein